MKNNRIVIIGLGDIGLELLRRLAREFQVLCIDRRHEAAPALARFPSARFLHGDAASRLTLQDAQVNDADAVIITTTDERSAIEIARLLREGFECRRVVSVAVTPGGMKALEELGVEVESMFSACAVGLRNRIEHRSKTAQAIGLFKDEILEVEVHPHSRLANKPLSAMDPLDWRLGIVYRDGNIIVPRPSTVLKPRDRVIILGDPMVLRTVSEVLTFNFMHFPLEFGSLGLVYLTGREGPELVKEIRYVFETFPLERVVFVYSGVRLNPDLKEALRSMDMKNTDVVDTALPPHAALEATTFDCGGRQGLLVLTEEALQAFSITPLKLRRVRFLQRMLATAKCPILIPRGSFPYESMCLPTWGAPRVERLIETAMEISRTISARLTVLGVRPSEYISGEDAIGRHEDTEKAVSSLSAVYRAKVATRVLPGNPILSVARVSSEYGLTVLGTERTVAQGMLEALLSPDIPSGAAVRTLNSTLLIPSGQEIF